jgi:predicted small secreted protein
VVSGRDTAQGSRPKTRKLLREGSNGGERKAARRRGIAGRLSGDVSRIRAKSWSDQLVLNRYFPRVEYGKRRYQILVSTSGLREVLMTLRLRLRGLSLAIAIFAVLGGGMLLSACGTVAGAGQDVSAIGNRVTGGAVQTQRATGMP